MPEGILSFLGVAFSLWPASSPPLREEASGHATCCNRVRALLTFGEGLISSPESPAPSALGVRSTGVWAVGVRRDVRACAKSFLVGGDGGHEQVCCPSVSCRDAPLDAALDVEGATLEMVGAVSSRIPFFGCRVTVREVPSDQGTRPIRRARSVRSLTDQGLTTTGSL